MKKLIYCALALAAGLFASSCQQENLEPVQEGNTVTFTVEIPEVATKAEVVDDGTNINNLVYAVYRTDGSDLTEAAASIDPTKLVYRINPKAQGEVTAFTADGKTNVTLELINNQKYIVLFWAQVNQTWVTGTEFDLTNIAYPNKLTANQNKYEAFCGAAFVDEVTGATKKSVTLTRPFAQINLASTDPANYNVDIVSSSVKIENAYPKFNVATKKASGEFRTVEYTTSENPDGNFGDYDHYVAMSYIFANPKEDGTSPVKVTCTINTASHGENIVKEVSNVPVAQNHRTNIIGDLLTSDVKYDVTLDNKWGTPSFEVEVVNSVAELASIFEELNDVNSTVTKAEVALGADMDLSELFNLGASTFATRAGETAPLPIIIPEGKTVVLNLNGYNVTVPEQIEGKHYYAFENRGDLTITSSNLKGSISARGIFNYGTMILESGTINAIDGNGGYGVRNYEGAEFVMNGGTVATIYEDGDNPGEGYDASPIRVDEGAKAEINGGIINNVSNFTVAIDNYGETIVNDGTFTTVHTTLANSAVMTINGGSFTCNGLEGTTAHALWAADGTTTINGGTFNGKDNYNGFNVDADEGAVVNITGGEFLPVHSGSLYGKGVIKVSGGTFFDDPSARLESGYKAEMKNDKYVVTEKDAVAKIGEKGYWSLNAAVAAVQDGETITLVADEVFTEANRYNNGGWWDGLGYSGDKSFTIAWEEKLSSRMVLSMPI